ncbi:PTS transporter subunit EIIC [Streptomyces sp. NPDC096012]|uniref:PTS transporter subunit EIIC n=1 Tax=Streptomyces sp. NPDC096012 TaxID=3155684 RepID=UPI00336AE928
MRNDPASTATAVLARVGGPANVTSVAHCMTRLRLGLADPAAADEAALRAVPGVLGVVDGGHAWQIVLGPGVVDQVTAAVETLLTNPPPADGTPADGPGPTTPQTVGAPLDRPGPSGPTAGARAPLGPSGPTPSPAVDSTPADHFEPTTPQAGGGIPADRPEPTAPQIVGAPLDRPGPTGPTAGARAPLGPPGPTPSPAADSTPAHHFEPTTPQAADSTPADHFEPTAPQTVGAPLHRPGPSGPTAGARAPLGPSGPTPSPAAAGARRRVGWFGGAAEGRGGSRGGSPREPSGQREATPLQAGLRRVASVFVPLIPALIGCGILAGVNGLLLNAGWLPGLTTALAAVASAFMALIAVFVGYNTAKEFGGTPVLGGAVAAVVVYPGVAKVSVFGTHLSPGQGGVLGALAAALLATRVEKWCRGRVPGALDVLLTPTVTVLVSGLVTLYGLMYAAGAVASGIGAGADWLLVNAGVVAGLVLGGLFLPLVMLGLHQALIPIHTTLIEQQGYTVLLPLLAMAGAGQVGAALAVYVRLRHDVSLRTTIRSALPAGLLGVGEPLIYGVCLPLGRPFLTACAGGAAGGAFVGFFAMLGTKVGATAIGPSGWALFPLLAGDRGPGPAAAVYGGGLLTGYAVGFAATYLFGFARRTSG